MDLKTDEGFLMIFETVGGTQWILRLLKNYNGYLRLSKDS